MKIPFPVLLFAILLAATPVRLAPDAGGSWPLGVSQALADDDDGGDDGDDDGSDDDGGGRSGGASEADDDRPRSGGDGGLLRRLFGRADAVPPPRAAVPRPLAAPEEIVVAGLDDDAVDRLVGEGFAVLASDGAAGRTVVRLRVPRALGVAGALERIALLAPDAAADRNHYYRPQSAGPSGCEAAVCASWETVGWRFDADRSCLAAITVGVVDTAVNRAQEALRASRVEHRPLQAEGQRAAGARHGTAVVSLLAGDPDGRVPGLIAQARIVVADPFAAAGNEERTDAFGLIVALDELDATGAQVLNLSLAGPDNRVVAARVADLLAAGAVLVAAVGNGGPRAKPLYPAAYEGVIGVTAVDGAGRVYRRAGRGGHVDLAAPGVAIPAAASIRGLRPQTGTSFAAPFVTAAAAVLLAGEPDLGAEGVLARLSAAAEDLGEPGRDPVYGAGLLQSAGDCRDPAVAGAGDRS
jgi:minor extracellular protease Epr